VNHADSAQYSGNIDMTLYDVDSESTAAVSSVFTRRVQELRGIGRCWKYSNSPDHLHTEFYLRAGGQNVSADPAATSPVAICSSRSTPVDVRGAHMAGQVLVSYEYLVWPLVGRFVSE